MICPECGEDNNVVICSRQKKTTHRRRRVCNSCGYRFSTTEYYVPDKYLGKPKPRKIFRAQELKDESVKTGGGRPLEYEKGE